jgi:hypothetical protein
MSASFGQAEAIERLRLLVKRRPDRSTAAHKAWRTRRAVSAFAKARASEAASKEALRLHCEQHGWKLAFFEGATGAPRTGIIDAIAYRLGRRNADLLDVRLVQLKGGKAGISGSEISRLKRASAGAKVNWLVAAFDGKTLNLLPDDLAGREPRLKPHT